MMPVAKHGDVQLGVDVHLCMVPTPVPTPTPLPTPHSSVVFDPFDYVPIIGATVTVCGMKRATAGTNAKVVHIPPGFPFAPKLPDTDDELFMGSATVIADGDPLSHISHPVLACQAAGMLSPFRIRKKGWPKVGVAPTVFNLATPTTVFIGGPPTISMMGMAMKGIFAGLGRLARSGLFRRLRQRLFRNMKPGFLKCVVLRAEPVNILDGSVSVEQQDFTLPGRLPVDWLRTYSSSNPHVGVCGPGWETPADIRLEFEPDRQGVMLQGPAIGPSYFERPPSGIGDEGAVLELCDGARLLDLGDEWQVATKDDRIYHFPKSLTRARPEGGSVTPLGRISDRSGNGLDFEYREGRLVALEDSAGRRLHLTIHDQRLLAVTLIDAATGMEHGFVRYEYDQAGDLVAVIDAMGEPYRFAYDGAHHMVRHTDRRGLAFHYAYEAAADGSLRVVHAWGDGGLYDYRFEYLDAVDERRITDSLGKVSIVKLDDRGLPISEIDPLGGMTVYEYDDAGRTTGVVDPAGRRTEYGYDERGNLLKLVRPDGVALVTEFDDANKPVTVFDALGNAWRQGFDTRGLLVEQISPLGHVSRYEYDPVGQLAAFVNPRGARTELRYDASGQLVQLTDALGHSTRFAHDLVGNLVAKLDPLDRKTRYQYDAKGRLLAVELPSGSEVRCGYDAEDNLTRYTDENGAVTRLEYYGQGEIARRIQPDGHPVEYLYDTEERLVGVRNQRGETYRLRRDALGRIVEEVDYWGQSRHYGYDGSGHLQWSEDPLRRRIAYQCDPLGRILSKSFADPLRGQHPEAGPFVESFAYDANGNLVETANPHVKVSRAFDAEGRLVEEVQAHTAGQRFTVCNGYDEVGNRTRRVTESSAGPGHATEYAYDLLDQSVGVRIDGGPPMRMQRDAAGQITAEELAPGLTRRYRYNADGLMTEQAVARDGQPLFATRYDYDRAGNLTRRHDSQLGIDRYLYDPMGRIVEHIDPQDRLERYFNDPAGDRLVTRVIEADQETTMVWGMTDTWRREGEYSGARYRFDRAGNLTKKADAQSRLDFAWDANQRLIASRRETSEGRRITTYGYDPLGRRLFKETEGERTWFGWDGDVVALEAARSGRSTFVYRSDSAELLAHISPEVEWLVNDPNGSPCRLLTNPPITPAEGFDRPSTERFGLQGQFIDAETDLAYNRYRYYIPEIEQFASADPLGIVPDSNVYAFAPNQFCWIDPLGLAKCRIPKKKLRYALGYYKHNPASVSKGALFKAKGFGLKSLRSEVESLFERGTPTNIRITEFGRQFSIVGEITAKSGEKVSVATGWILDHGSTIPRLVTITPH